MSPGLIQKVPIGEFVDPVLTWNPQRDSKSTTFRYVDLSSIDQSTKRIVLNGEIPVNDAPSRARQLVRTGDVLVSTVRPNLNGVAFVPSELDGATASTGFCVLRPKPKLLWSRYLFHWVQTPQFVADMVKKATGQSYPAVSDRIVKESVFPLLSLGEQRRIAAILDQADMLLRARCRSIKRLDELGQSIFNAMFGDPVTNPKKWDIGLCSDQCSRITVGVVVKPASYYKESGVPALRSVNIKSEGINLDDIVYFSEEDNLRKLSKTRVWSGDLVIVRSGRPGLAAVIPNEMDGINAIDLLIATPNQEKITPIFFREFINSPGGKRIVLSQKRGQVQQHFNVGSLSNATMILPPIDLQRKFEDRLKLIASQRETMHRGSNDVENLFRSLQQRAFHGEL